MLACYKLGAILEGTYARACAGRAPKETGDFLHASTVSLFTRALNKIGLAPPAMKQGLMRAANRGRGFT